MSLKVICRCGQALRVKPDAARYKCPKCLETYPVNQKTELEAGTVEEPEPKKSSMKTFLELHLDTPSLVEKLEPKKPWTKDPIIVIGAAVPTLILLAFGGYLILDRLPRKSVGEPKAHEMPASEFVPYKRNPLVPPIVSYPIINEHVNDRTHIVNVQLSQKVPVETLEAIIMEVKGAEQEQYMYTHICFYLPGEFSKDQPHQWASAHFMPRYDYKIHGFTIEQDEAMRNWKLEPGYEVSKWYFESGLYSEYLVVYATNGKIQFVDLDIPGVGDGARPWRRPATDISIGLTRAFKLEGSSNSYKFDDKEVLWIRPSEPALRAIEGKKVQ